MNKYKSPFKVKNNVTQSKKKKSEYDYADWPKKWGKKRREAENRRNDKT